MSVGPAKVLAQTNIYFDTTQRALLGTGHTLRVRIDEAVRVTLKGPGRIEAGVSAREETECLADEALTRAAIGGYLTHVDAAVLPVEIGERVTMLVGSAALHPLGASRNERHVGYVQAAAVGLDGGFGTLKIEIDRTSYPDGSEGFEIELEHARAAEIEGALASWLAARGVRCERSTDTKFARFMRALAAVPPGPRDLA